MSPEEEKSLQLVQWNETTHQWENITTYIDIKNNLLVGEASHLSCFGITCASAPVPEFQPIIIMPLLMMATLLATIAWRRKENRK